MQMLNVVVRVLGAVACLSLGAWSPFSARNSDVERGKAAMKAGEPQAALEAFDRAVAGATRRRRFNSTGAWPWPS